MKLFKKVMSLIIASIMMLQVAAFAAPAPADVEGKFYEDAAKLLSALEIMVGDGNSFNGDNNITRAEFTKIMVTAAGHANIVAGYKAKGVFADVAVSEWYAPYVEFGKDMGAINGMGDGTFAPNDKVTGEQAVKMMVSVIGYGLKAEAEGGWPSGYTSVGRDIGALKGIANIDLTAPLTRGQAAVLCANILDIDVMKKVSSGDVEKWEAKEGVTLLTDKFNTYKIEGLVSANSTTSLWEGSDLKAGEVEIAAKAGNIAFLAGETDIEQKIGSTVKAYYTYDEDTEKNTIIAYSASGKKNTMVEVAIEDLELDSSTNAVVKYWGEGNDAEEEEVEVEAMPAIIYNGAATTSSDDLKTILTGIIDMPGKVVFIDSDSTKGAETVMITAYETYVVEFIDLDSYVLLDEFGDYKNAAGATKSITIDVEDKNTFATFTDKNGKALSFDSIVAGDVLSVAASDLSATKKVFNVIISDSTVSGVVDSFGTNADGKTFVALDDGEDYIFGDALEAYAAEMGHGLKLGKGVEFKLDAFGRVAAIKSASSGKADGEYGIILQYVPSQGTRGTIDMKVFTAAGEYEIIPLASKVTIDGAKKTNDTDIMAALADSITKSWKIYDVSNGYAKYDDGTVAEISPMLYKLDDQGAIKYIDTPFKGVDEDEYVLGRIKGGATGPKEMSYQSGYGGFNYTTALNSAAIIFSIPAQAEELNNEKKLKIYKASEFKSGESYTLQLFNTDRESRAYDYGICVFSSGSSDTEVFRTADTESSQRQRPLFIVTKTTQTLTEDEYGEDMITLKIYGNEEGSSKTLTVDADYFQNGQYIEGSDSLADHLFNGVTFNVEGTGSRNARIKAIHGGVMDEQRASQIVMPGDIFVYGLNAQGEVRYVRTIYLAHENIFLSKNDISAGRRFESTDLALPYEKEGDSVMFATISNPASGSIATQFEVADGYITKDASGASILTDGKYNAELVTTNMTYNVSKVVVYDAAATKEADRVKTGSVADIVDLSNPLVTATPCIVRVYNSGIKVAVVLKNLPDTPVAPTPVE